MSDSQLESQLTGNTWLNKDFLVVHSTVSSAIADGKEWFYSQAPIQAMMSNPALRILADVIASIKNVAESVKYCALVFCETAYGINKAVNSREHKDLAAVGNRMLSSLSPQPGIYKSLVIAHNETLNLPELTQIGQNAIPSIGGNPLDELKEMVDENLKKLIALKDSLIKQIETLSGAAKAKAKRLLNKILAIIDKIAGKSSSSLKFTGSPKSTSASKGVIVPIPTGSAATVAGTIAIVSAITGFFLKIFTGGALSGIVFEALVKAATSVALKFIGSSGAIAARYLAASVFKAAIKSLPALIAKTGTFAGSWAFMMAFAPAIILSAIIASEASKNRVKLGEFLYIFGLDEKQKEPDRGFVVLSKTNRIEMETEMVNMGASMISESRKNYDTLIGIAVDRKTLEPVLAVDMVRIDVPVRYASKEDLARVCSPWKQKIIDANDPSKPPY
jgi:hypothetical protein